MKKKNGFTLVELLAVIVILAIILLIAVPNVIGIIDKAKKDSYCSTAKMAYKAVEYFKLQEPDAINAIPSDGKLVITFDGTSAVVTYTGTGADALTAPNFTNLDGIERFASGTLEIAPNGTIAVGTALKAAEGGYEITSVNHKECAGL